MKKLLITLVMLLWAGVAMAQNGLVIHDAWIRIISSHVPAAGYFAVDNNSNEAVKLVAVETPAYARAMLHRSVEKNGQSSMVHVDSVKIPAGGHITFAPGGYHVMLMQSKQTLEPGDTVPVTLVFADGSHLTTEFQVRSAFGQAD